MKHGKEDNLSERPVVEKQVWMVLQPLIVSPKATLLKNAIVSILVENVVVSTIVFYTNPQLTNKLLLTDDPICSCYFQCSCSYCS